MKAAVLVEQGKPLEIADVSLPDELSFGQVLVKLHYSGICGAQLNEIDGAKGPDRFLPHLLGHEGSGTVLELGAGVTSVATGDHVVLHWRPSDGLQSQTPSYDWNGRRVNAGWVTTFNETAVISENRLTKISADFDLRVAPLFGCAVTTAFGVINNDARLKVGQSVIVMGVGGVGLNIVQAARMVSGHPIVAIDLHASKLALAGRLGATHLLRADLAGNLEEQLREIVGSDGADVVIDTTGSARVIEMAYGLTRPDGKTILVGVPHKDDPISIYSLPLHFDKVLSGSHGGDARPHIDIPNYIRLMEAGKMSLDGLVTHEFALDDINDAIQRMRAGDTGRVMIKLGQE